MCMEGGRACDGDHETKVTVGSAGVDGDSACSVCMVFFSCGRRLIFVGPDPSNTTLFLRANATTALRNIA